MLHRSYFNSLANMAIKSSVPWFPSNCDCSQSMSLIDEILQTIGRPSWPIPIREGIHADQTSEVAR